MARQHRSCGTQNPFGARYIWAMWAITAAAAMPLTIIYGFWGLITWVLYPILMAPNIWWEHTHSVRKMYVTWWP